MGTVLTIRGPNSEIETPILKDRQIKRFWEKVNRDVPPDRCWIWQSCVHEGYGRVNVNYKNHKAIRIAFSIANGPLPPNKVVAHSCDNPLCVNPSHLFMTDQRGNMWDAIRKGRFGPNMAPKPSGDQHWMSRNRNKTMRNSLGRFAKKERE